MVRVLGLCAMFAWVMGPATTQMGPRPIHGYGCACPCVPRHVDTVVWRPENGGANEFIGQTLKSGYRRGEPLILLGRSDRGVWSVIALEGEDELDIRLVCFKPDGKRKSFLLQQFFPLPNDTGAPGRTGAGLSAGVLTGLRRLERRGIWNPKQLVPIEVPLLTTYPRMKMRETGDPEEASFAWTLRASLAGGPYVSIARGTPNGGKARNSYYRGSRWIAGIPDGAAGEIWWVNLAEAQGDSCGFEWLAVRLKPATGKAQ